jgi:hypothetical protein
VLSISEQYLSDNYSVSVDRVSEALKAAGIREEFTGIENGKLKITFESREHYTEFLLRWS